MTGDVIRFRIDAQTKRAFLDACHSRDLDASQVLRAAVRAFLSDKKQVDLEDLLRR